MNRNGWSDKGGSPRGGFGADGFGCALSFFMATPYRDPRVSCKEGICPAIL